MSQTRDNAVALIREEPARIIHPARAHFDDSSLYSVVGGEGCSSLPRRFSRNGGCFPALVLFTGEFRPRLLI